jgi:uncharacterized protein (TIGR03086 family)
MIMSTTSPDVVDLYRRAAAFFGQQVIAIGDDEWDLPTPSSEWIVKAVVAHLVVAEAQMADVIDGRPFERLDVDVSILGHDPVSVWRGTAVNALHAIADADLDKLVEHPAGTMQLRNVVGFRITENLVHGWDIATARGLEIELDSEIAAWCLEFWLPLADGLADSGFFATMVEPAGDDPGSRLLALLGRAR